MRLACALLLFLVTGTAAAECECLWQGAFVDVHEGADLVVSGTVLSAKGNSVDVAVQRVMSGRQPLETIRVWMKAADYCRPEAALFPPGSAWVLALHEITEQVPGGFNPGKPNISYGRIGDYRLSACGGYWLSQTGDRVTGNLVDAPRWVRDPEMTPVLLDLVDAFVRGDIGRDALAEASREDPALKELMLDTRAFLRDEN